MNLLEWASIPDERKRQLIVHWCKVGDWGEYERMATEAAAALKKELASVLGISNVEVGGGQVLSSNPMLPVRELALDVLTLLPIANRLEEVPNQFAGFSVRQVNLGDKRKSFLRTWTQLFKELKGWDESATLAWVEKWEDDLSGRRPSAIYHYGPVKAALSSLVDERVKATMGDRLQSLYGKIRDVIERTEDVTSMRIEHPDTVEDYDWGYVRRRIAELIETYEAKVERPPFVSPGE